MSPYTSSAILKCSSNGIASRWKVVLGAYRPCIGDSDGFEVRKLTAQILISNYEAPCDLSLGTGFQQLCNCHLFCTCELYLLYFERELLYRPRRAPKSVGGLLVRSNWERKNVLKSCAQDFNIYFIKHAKITLIESVKHT